MEDQLGPGTGSTSHTLSFPAAHSHVHLFNYLFGKYRCLLCPCPFVMIWACGECDGPWSSEAETWATSSTDHNR